MAQAPMSNTGYQNYIEVTLSRTALDIPNNRSQWAWGAKIINNAQGYGTVNWSLGGFATGGGSFMVHERSPGLGLGPFVIQLGGGSFWKTHASDGTLASSELSVSANSNSSWIGSGGVSQGTGVIPRIPRGPRVKHEGSWKQTVAYVKHEGNWKIAIPYTKHEGNWKIGGG